MNGRCLLQVHYMFGGNPGGKEGKDSKVRLGDFWQLCLYRPSRAQVLRRCVVAVRRARFCELAAKGDGSHAKKAVNGLSQSTTQQKSAAL